MAKENENQALRGYSNRRKRYKRIRNTIAATLLLAVVVIGLIYSIYIFNRSYHGYKVVKSTELIGDNSGGFLSYGSSIIRYNKDGAAAYNQSGNILWKGSYNMSDPIADTCGQYVVIADRGGTSVHIYNNKKEVGNYSTTYEINKVSIASQGVVAVQMAEGNNVFIQLYDVDGTPLGDVAKTINNTGFPLDISLSRDGTKLVVIYMSVSKGDLISNVVCYNFTNVGKNYKDQCVGIYSFKNMVAPRVMFLNNDIFCVFKNNGFVLYSMKQLSNDLKEINFKDKIKSILYNSSYTGVVLESADGSSRHLVLYNLKGKKVLDKTLDFDYTSITMTEKEIIMYNNRSSAIMKMNGKIKFRYTFNGEISGLYPINNMDSYYLIREAKLTDIQLTD